MIDYLINYGVNQHTPNVVDLDITDKMRLESQINEARKGYADMLRLLDDVQTQLTDTNREIAKRSKELIASNTSYGRVSALLNADQQYVELTAKAEAFSSALKMISQWIDFYKSDLGILRSSLYNKF